MNDLTNKDFQLFCDEELAKGTSIIVIREIILLIKLAIKREAKINGIQPLFINLDLPSITKKKKIQIGTPEQKVGPS